MSDLRFKRIKFLSKIHSFNWNSKQDSIVRYVTKDSIWHLTLKGQDLNSYPYWNSYRSKIHTNPPEINTDKKLWMNIPLWDMRQKIQFDIQILKQDLNSDQKFIS